MLPITTNFTSSGKTYSIDIFNPNISPNGGVIIIAHGSDGPIDNDNGPWLTMMTGYARDLAEKGFVALMPNYLDETNTVNIQQLSNYQATLADAVVYAKTLPEVDASRIGLLGFSLGGYLCLRNRSQAKVLVEYFAPLFEEAGGIGLSGSPSLYAQIHHGTADELLPLGLNAKPIEQRLHSEGADVELFSYKDAGHGFNGKHSGDSIAQIKSKERTMTFFKKYL
ncbi:MAG: dienelactone hydrolase family protein [Methylosarcina sp.]